MSRTTINLSHLLHICGQIGRVQTLTVVPVVGGDSLDIKLDSVLRLAATRKEITSECQVDICAFYVKHRHVLGQDAYTKWMRNGPQQAAAWPFAGISVASQYRDCFYLGIKQCDAEVNAALLRGYNFIMQRYFFVPNTYDNGELQLVSGSTQPYQLDFYPTSQSYASNYRNYGTMAARLPHILNGFNPINSMTAGGFDNNLTAADYGVIINDAAPNVGRLDIRDLGAIQARYETVQEASFFASFYDDLMQKRYHVDGLNTDADPRPDMLGRETFMLSGHDVDGTDDATLGSYVGKTVGRGGFNMQRRFFPEHGNVFILAVLRYPLVHTREQHPLLARATPDTTLVQADPRLWAEQKPVAFAPGNWIAGGSIYTPDIDRAVQPYGQEYRYQPNRVHPNFDIIPGYPFIDWDTTNPQRWMYYSDGEYNDTFQTSQLAHWQMHARCDVTRYSHAPAPVESIFAGT